MGSIDATWPHLHPLQVSLYGIQPTFWADSDGFLHVLTQDQAAADLARRLTNTLDGHTLNLLIDHLLLEQRSRSTPSCNSVPYHRGRWAKEPKPAKPTVTSVPYHAVRWSGQSPPPPPPIGSFYRSRSDSTSSTNSFVSEIPVTPPVELSAPATRSGSCAANDYWASRYQGPPMWNKAYPQAFNVSNQEIASPTPARVFNGQAFALSLEAPPGTAASLLASMLAGDGSKWGSRAASDKDAM